MTPWHLPPLENLQSPLALPWNFCHLPNISQEGGFYLPPPPLHITVKCSLFIVSIYSSKLTFCNLLSSLSLWWFMTPGDNIYVDTKILYLGRISINVLNRFNSRSNTSYYSNLISLQDFNSVHLVYMGIHYELKWALCLISCNFKAWRLTWKLTKVCLTEKFVRKGIYLAWWVGGRVFTVFDVLCSDEVSSACVTVPLWLSW